MILGTSFLGILAAAFLYFDGLNFHILKYDVK